MKVPARHPTIGRCRGGAGAPTVARRNPHKRRPPMEQPSPVSRSPRRAICRSVALTLVALLALAGCTLPGELHSTPTVDVPPPTWTPDPAVLAVRPIAPAEYRRATEARGDRINAAIER